MLKARLGHLLATRVCLLIVDDVWQHTRADHFRVGGPHCRLLITTRDAEVARELGAHMHSIPLMTEDEAVALLVTWADGAVRVIEHDMQKQIINRLGRLPLAVKLAGAQLRSQPPEDWLRRFDVRKLRSSRPEDLHDSLEQTFKLSIEDVDIRAQRLYAALVIFRADEAIPEMGIVRLWEGLERLDREQTSRIIEDLAARALLQVSVGSPRTIILHNLLRDLMHAELDDDVVVIHEALLNAYATTQHGEGWQTAPDDGYLYTHLAYHLIAAGRKNDLCMLITASPSWMETKFRVLGSDMSYATDVNVAISAFKGAATATELFQLAQLVTVRHVVQQRVNVYTDTDLQTLVWLGRDVEAMSHARLRPSPRERSMGLIMIHDVQLARDHAEGRLLVEALEAAGAIQDTAARATVLSMAASSLMQAGQREEACQVLLEAWEGARDIEDARERAAVLSGIAPLLAQAGYVEQALKATRETEDTRGRAAALSAVVSALAQAGYVEQAQEATWFIDNAAARAEALSTVALALAHAGREKEASQVFSKAKEAASSRQYDDARAYALSTVALVLAHAGREEEANQVFSVARWAALSRRYDDARVYALNTVALALAQAGREERASRVLSEVLKEAQVIEDIRGRAMVLSTVALALAQAGRKEEANQALSEALKTAQTLEDVDAYAAVLNMVVSSLAQAGQGEPALKAAQAIKNADARAAVLSRAAPLLAQVGQVKPALEAAQASEDTRGRAAALSAVVSSLVQAGQVEPALVATQAIEDIRGRAMVLSTVALALVQAGKEERAGQVLSEALKAAQAIENTCSRIEALSTVASVLTQAGRGEEANRLLSEARETIRAIENANAYPAVLSMVAPLLAQAGRGEPALEAVRSIEDIDAYAAELSTVALALAISFAIFHPRGVFNVRVCHGNLNSSKMS